MKTLIEKRWFWPSVWFFAGIIFANVFPSLRYRYISQNVSGISVLYRIDNLTFTTEISAMGGDWREIK